MSFAFNFDETGSDVGGDRQEVQETQCVYVPKVINVSESSFEDDCSLHTINIKDFLVLDETALIEKLRDFPDFPVSLADAKHSDLVPDIYEGGLKIWECELDLLQFLSDREKLLQEKTVLELGCGAGLAGMECLRRGSSVTFQDYNEEVVRHFTIPNVLLNFDAEKATTSCCFVAGDWSNIAEVLPHKFDLILTAETIYNANSYGKLHKAFTSVLKPNGKILLAAKSYYFGVGGSLSEWKDYVEQQRVFSFNVVWKSDSGLVREIVQMEFKTT